MMMLLHLIVVVNLYNLIIIQLNDKVATRILLAENFDTEQIIVSVQTIASMLAILLGLKRKPSAAILTIKYTVLALIYITLLGDVLSSIMIANNLFFNKKLDEFWMTTKDENSAAPERVCFFVASVLALYFVFKLYAAWLIFRFVKKFCDGESKDVLVYLVTSDYTEQKQNISCEKTILA